MHTLSREQEHALEALVLEEERSNRCSDANGCCHAGPVPPGELEALLSGGCLRRDGERLVLTAAGRTRGLSLLRRHRLTEVLIDSALGLDRQRSHDIGCQMEHQMLPEFVEAFCTLLGHPTTCPHGRPIPPGPCCEAHRTSVDSQVVPLSALRPGDRGRVIFIRPRTHQRLHRLTSLGLTPGVVVQLHQRKPAFCIRFEGTDLAIDRDVAQDIHVARLPD